MKQTILTVLICAIIIYVLSVLYLTHTGALIGDALIISVKCLLPGIGISMVFFSLIREITYNTMMKKRSILLIAGTLFIFIFLFFVAFGTTLILADTLTLIMILFIILIWNRIAIKSSKA